MTGPGTTGLKLVIKKNGEEELDKEYDEPEEEEEEELLENEEGGRSNTKKGINVITFVCNRIQDE